MKKPPFRFGKEGAGEWCV